MKKRIFMTLAGMLLAALTALYLISIPVYYSFYKNEAQSQLRSLARVALSTSQDYASLTRAVNDAAPYPIRLSVISPDGDVLYDSEADAATLGNHADRPEIKEALADGTGEDSRRSASLGQRTFYYAVRSGDRIVRFSRNLDTLSRMFFSTFPLTFFLLFLLISVAVTATSRLTRRIIQPVEELVSTLSATADGQIPDYHDIDIYPELLPLSYRIKEMSRSILHQIGQLEEERDTIRTIMESMQEGLVMLGPRYKILSVNESACRLLNPGFKPTPGSSLLELTRNPLIYDALEHAQTDGHAQVHIDESMLSSRHLRVTADRVSAADGQGGAILLIMDVTRERQAELMRRDFAANVSHELKTPLTTIKGFGELLAGGMVPQSQDVVHYGKTILREADRLLLLITDILHLSEIEEGKAAFAPVELAERAQNAVALLQEHAAQRGVTVTLTGGPLTINANRTYIDELFINLIDNAIKYNKPDGQVKVSITRRDDAAEISVKDTGVGIPEAHRARIFERFYRVDQSRSKDTGGTGLGLSIVKHIIACHHGQISLTSSVGQGTSIVVTLPVDL